MFDQGPYSGKRVPLEQPIVADIEYLAKREKTAREAQAEAMMEARERRWIGWVAPIPAHVSWGIPVLRRVACRT